MITKLVLIISNWSFVRDNANNRRRIKCTAQDVTIGLKLSSTDFRSGSSQQTNKTGYDFDKNGLTLPYSAFLSLLKDENFTDDYMTKVKTRYTSDTGDSLSEVSETSQKVRPKVPVSASSLRRKYADAFPELQESEPEIGESEGSVIAEEEELGERIEDPPAIEGGSKGKVATHKARLRRS